MHKSSLEIFLQQWKEQLKCLRVEIKPVSNTRQVDHVEMIDIQTGKMLRISAQKIEEKIQEKEMDSVMRLYTDFIRNWQHVLHSSNEICPEKIFPVLRPKSIIHTKSFQQVHWYPHTIETVIALALDQEKGYKLLSKEELEKTGLEEEEWLMLALENLRQKPFSVKKETVAGSHLYFFHANDGYDAARMLIDDLWLGAIGKRREDVFVSIPHQDVFIVAKCHAKSGLQILARMTLEFYTEGRSPITSFSFHYPNGQQIPEPLFIFLHHHSNQKADK